MKIGFFGLGNMGLPMARNLVKAGHTVKGYDVVADAVEAFSKDGGEGVSSVVQACTNVDVIVTMLPSGKIAKDLYLGETGILKNIDSSVLLIDSSTIAAEDAKEIGEHAKSHGNLMIDAPVSGGVAGATAGTLSFIVGGPKDAFDKAKPILENMGANIFHAGESGAGQVAKICNNMLLAIHMVGTCEALNMGMKHGLDPIILSEIMKKSSGDNWSLQKYNPVPGVMETTPSSHEYRGGFGSNLMLKDLGLAQEAASASDSQTPLGKFVYELYTSHCKENGDLDFSSILNLIKG